jgi:hypothetical protein
VPVVAGLVVGLAAISVAVLPTQAAFAGTDVVTNCSGSAAVAGSLPYEVANANPGDDITFALSPACATISLTSTIDIAVNLTITGPSAGALAVNGNGSQPVFSLTSATATISGLSIENGGGSDGGGIFNSGRLTVSHSTVSNNTAGVAGGIFNNGTLTVDMSTVSGNAGTFDAGGIFNNGTATVENSTVSDNTSAYGGGASRASSPR